MTYTNTKQRGFTLIELLVVIGIIAALAAVVIPNVARFMGSGELASNIAELPNVQAALDLFLTENPAGGAAQAVATNNMTLSTPALSPLYIREATTKCTYTWTLAGTVTQVAC